jgi:diguanylate cyclase (GGDEF)-like protein
MFVNSICIRIVLFIFFLLFSNILNAQGLSDVETEKLVKLHYNITLEETEYKTSLSNLIRSSQSKQIGIIVDILSIKKDIERLSNSNVADRLSKLKADIFTNDKATSVIEGMEVSAVFWYAANNLLNYTLMNYPKASDFSSYQNKLVNENRVLHTYQDYFTYLNILTQHAKSQHEEKLSVLFRLLRKAESENDTDLKLHALQGLASTYVSGVDSEKALSYLTELLDIASENRIDNFFTLSAKINILNISPRTPGAPNTAKFAEELIRDADASNDDGIRFISYVSAVSSYTMLGDVQKVSELMKKAEPLAQKFFWVKSFYFYYVFYCVKLNNLNGEYELSRIVLDEFYDSLNDTKSPKVYPVLTAYYLSSENTHIGLGDYKSAYEESNLRSDLLNSFLRDKYERASFDAAQKHNVEREKEKALAAKELLIAEQAKNKFRTFSVIMMACLLLVLFLLLVKQVQSKKLSEKLSNTDPLTGLSNRRYVLNALSKRWRERASSKSSLILFDIDNFKSINDSYGHGVGDLAIKHVVELAKAHCRKDDILARIGGEEFLLVAFDLPMSLTLDVAERIRKSLVETPLIIDECKTITVTASFGVTEQSGYDTSIDDTIRLADEALYEAKGSGRNNVKFKAA